MQLLSGRFTKRPLDILGYLSKHFKDSILKYQSKSGEHKYFRQSIKVGLGKKHSHVKVYMVTTSIFSFPMFLWWLKKMTSFLVQASTDNILVHQGNICCCIDANVLSYYYLDGKGGMISVLETLFLNLNGPICIIEQSKWFYCLCISLLEMQNKIPLSWLNNRNSGRAGWLQD